MSKFNRAGSDGRMIRWIAVETSVPFVAQRAGRLFRVNENGVGNCRKASSFGRFKHNKRGHYGSSF
jgi:hypothetical protein